MGRVDCPFADGILQMADGILAICFKPFFATTLGSALDFIRFDSRCQKYVGDACFMRGVQPRFWLNAAGHGAHISPIM